MGIREFSRAERVAEQFRRELANILARDSGDPRFSRLTISDVVVSRDLSHARVYITPRESTEATRIVRALRRASGYLRHALAKRMRMRNIPRIEFVYDPSLDEACRIASLLDGASARHANDAPWRDENDE